MCALTGSNAQDDEKSRYKGKLKQKEFLEVDYMFFW